MKLDEAIAHTKLMIERGDKECNTTTWRGGGFKREAIQALLDGLAAAEAARQPHSLTEADNNG